MERACKLPAAGNDGQALAASLTCGIAKEATEKVLPDQELEPQRLKRHSKQCSYRSGKPLRHPKSSATRVSPQP
jgi:hypothetical protein